MKQYNLIIADDDATIRRLLELKSTQYGFHPITVENGQQLLEKINDHVEVILLDINMPTMDGFQCLEKLADLNCKIPVIILSSEQETVTAVKAVKLGALDYITKPFDLNDLFTALRNASRISKIQNENNELKENYNDTLSENSSSVNLIAESPPIHKLQEQALKVAKLDSSILLTGESGTGKSVFARYIHANSNRRNKPFVTVSCPALPRELLESELFGHEKGAFTGAIKRRIGKIEAASGGTLFLDEIGELPLDLQPKLLNVLQDQEFTRIGGDKVIKSNVRLITATNINFPEKIANKEFRDDLYYRISVIPLELPSLKNQPENITPLAQHFLKRIAKNQQNKNLSISDEAMDAIRLYHWPGNIRQLENVIERSAAFCSDSHIKIDDLPQKILESRSVDNSSSPTIIGLAGHTLAEIEFQAISQTLASCGGNKAKTARKLGISEKSIYNKMKRHNL